jgi:hypothetical protein
MRKTGQKPLQHDTTRQPRGCAPHGSTTKQVDTTPQRNRRRQKTGYTAPNYHAGPKAAPLLAEDESASAEPASAEPPKHSASPSIRWTPKARPQEAKRHKIAAHARSS